MTILATLNDAPRCLFWKQAIFRTAAALPQKPTHLPQPEHSGTPHMCTREVGTYRYLLNSNRQQRRKSNVLGLIGSTQKKSERKDQIKKKGEKAREICLRMGRNPRDKFGYGLLLHNANAVSYKMLKV